MMIVMFVIGIFSIWLITTMKVDDIDNTGIPGAMFISVLYMIVAVSVLVTLMLLSRRLWLEVVWFVG